VKRAFPILFPCSRSAVSAARVHEWWAGQANPSPVRAREDGGHTATLSGSITSPPWCRHGTLAVQPLLERRGIHLSPAHVYRLVSQIRPASMDSSCRPAATSAPGTPWRLPGPDFHRPGQSELIPRDRDAPHHLLLVIAPELCGDTPRNRGRSIGPRRESRNLAAVGLCLGVYLVGGEAGCQRGQHGVEVDGEVSVGSCDPPFVGGPAGGEGGVSDGERVERICGLANAGCDEVADDLLRCVVVGRGAGLQGGHRADQVHPSTQFGHVFGAVAIGC
jgi:hypothetical protein